MFVSGFTFVRNALRFDYPVVESLRSLLPVCDEVVVAVGNSDDGTRDLVASVDPSKIRIVDTLWDDSLREGGRVLALETDKAFDAVSPQADWAFYLQADEVLHESEYPAIRRAMETWQDQPRVEGLLFDYLHFTGSYDYIGNSRDWYRHEVRIIRNDKRIRSYRDAQGFRIDGRKLNVKPAGAHIHHYGWVKPPEFQQAKQENFNRYWHSDEWIEKHVPRATGYDYSAFRSLAKFEGTHPAVMHERIARLNWPFSYDPAFDQKSPKARLLHFIEQTTGWRPGEYKNYRLI
jgi:glycosyltransferase involved in cell wall biosynthesis